MAISFLTSRELQVIRSFICNTKVLLWSKSKTWNELKFGIWTFFCQCSPSTRAEMTCIPQHKTWQMNLLWLMGSPSSRAEMPWLPVHKTWQINLLWPMNPQHQRRDALNTSTHNLADEPTLAWWTPLVPEQRCLEYQYTILCRWTDFAQWTPQGNRAEMPSHC